MNNLKILEYHTFATVRASLHFKLALFLVVLHLARTTQERTAILHVRALQWRVLARSHMLLEESNIMLRLKRVHYCMGARYYAGVFVNIGPGMLKPFCT